MSVSLKISIQPLKIATKGSLVLFCDDGLKFAPAASEFQDHKGLKKAIKSAGFKGDFLSHIELLAPEGSSLDRIIVMGLGKDLDDHSYLRIGGKLLSILASASANDVSILAELPAKLEKKSALTTAQISQIAMGADLSSYRFTRHKKQTLKKPSAMKMNIATALTAGAKKQWAQDKGVSDGVKLARDLVNEPANYLGPVEFAAKAKALTKLGAKVSILTEKQMEKLGMGSLLSVAEGSARPARLAVMEWKGGKAKDAPVAFIGKGVVFDTGGISIKPSAGMEDMKGDMGGAAAVTGLMHALAARKAKVNAVGIIGLVENMPGSKATRPGDIVTSMSGQTIEVLNTDAEGRLVLADCLTYCEKKYKPKFMVNLATLTGAILVALGNEYAGLFSNNDKLAKQLSEAGETSHEKLWRMPLHPKYDKLLDSKNADMKNIGGRLAGSCTAGQFLQRFVEKTPWAHLDIAGTAMASPQNEINHSWASGYGVRLLDQLVKDHYE